MSQPADRNRRRHSVGSGVDGALDPGQLAPQSVGEPHLRNGQFDDDTTEFCGGSWVAPEPSDGATFHSTLPGA